MARAACMSVSDIVGVWQNVCRSPHTVRALAADINFETVRAERLFNLLCTVFFDSASLVVTRATSYEPSFVLQILPGVRVQLDTLGADVDTAVQKLIEYRPKQARQLFREIQTVHDSHLPLLFKTASCKSINTYTCALPLDSTVDLSGPRRDLALGIIWTAVKVKNYTATHVAVKKLLESTPAVVQPGVKTSAQALCVRKYFCEEVIPLLTELVNAHAV